MSINEMKSRYVELFGAEPTAPENLAAIERLLSVRLPDDFRSISTFYSGGMFGRKSLNAFAPTGPAANIGDDTVRYRRGANIPQPMIVLAELDESFIVLDTAPELGRPAVLWCDNYDVMNLSQPEKLNSPQTWNSFAEFFESLLADEQHNSRQGGRG